MGKQWKQCQTLFFLSSKITSDGDGSHEIKRHLLLGRKVMTNLDSILKSRDITLPTKVHLVKAMFFPVVMYGCESWTVKKAECWKIDAFELWCWTRLLRVPWTARRSNQSILKEISPGCSLEGLMLKLKLQYFGHQMRRVDSLEKTLIFGKIESKRRSGWRKMVAYHHILNGHGFGWTPGVGDGQGDLACCSSWGRKELDTTERLNWTELIFHIIVILYLISYILKFYRTLLLLFYTVSIIQICSHFILYFPFSSSYSSMLLANIIFLLPEKNFSLG